MPGNLEALEPAIARGWARHPRHDGYAMLVHALVQGRVVASGLADLPRPDVPGGGGFALRLPDVMPTHVRILLGETDEYLDHPAQQDPLPRRLTVEDLVGTVTRRAWVKGACHIDAAAAGLLPETIIDLICRDYLARPAGPVIIGRGMARLAESGSHDATRRMLLESSEYRLRRVYADAAPGAIFSQAMVLGATRDYVTDAQRAARVITVPAAELLVLDGDQFVTECYRRILRKEPDRAGLAHYMTLLASTGKVAILRHLAAELEAVSAGVEVMDLPEED